MRNVYQVLVQRPLLGWKTALLLGFLTDISAAHAQSSPSPQPYRGLKQMQAPAARSKKAAASETQAPAPAPAKSSPATAPTPNSLTNGQGDDVRLFPSTAQQTEVHISIDKSAPGNLIAAANVVANGSFSQGYYYSQDGGVTWRGSDSFPNGGAGVSDPATAFDAGGTAYLATIATTGDRYGVQSSATHSTPAPNPWTWTAQVGGCIPENPGLEFDKEMIAADNTASSPYANTLYTAWTVFAQDNSTTIKFNHSTDRLQAVRGQAFTAPLVLVNPTPGHDTGVNVQTGPNGEVYVCWADYPQRVGGAATGIGFARSTNGGASFAVTPVAFAKAGIEVNGVHPDPIFNNTRVNDFPAMAVDKGPTHPGRIYITYAAKENGNGKAIIQVRYSDNQGASWTAPATVSIPAGRQNWFPWIAVDDCTGDVSVVYYSFDTASGFETNTYVAYSQDGGISFNNLKVSDASHTPTAISAPNISAGYAGDYIGITAYGGKAYPTWADNRTGTWQVYTSPVSYNFITGPDQLCASSSTVPFRAPTATANWSWTATPANLFTTSTAQGSQLVTAAAAGAQGTGTITATLPGGCAVLTKTVQVGAYPVTGTYYENGYNTLSSFNYVTTGTVTMYVQAGTGNTYSFATQFPTTTVYQNTPGSNTAYFYVGPGNGNNNRVQINVTASGPGVCGTSTTSSFQFYVPQTQAIAASPNPATSELAIQTVQPADAPQFSTPVPPPPGQSKPLPVDTDFTVQLYNSYGQLVKTGKSQQGKLKLNVLDLPNGLYTLRSGEGKEVVSEHIQIAH